MSAIEGGQGRSLDSDKQGLAEPGLRGPWTDEVEAAVREQPWERISNSAHAALTQWADEPNRIELDLEVIDDQFVKDSCAFTLLLLDSPVFLVKQGDADEAFAYGGRLSGGTRPSA